MFQSTPDLAAGRCRASPVCLRQGEGFNPRPTLQPGDARCRPDSRSALASFNPRPTLQPGDAGTRSARLRLGYRFNPRPTLQPGDAGCKGGARTENGRVSIHARPCSRAMHGANRQWRCVCSQVSIHARPCSRAMRHPRQSDGVDLGVSIHARPCSRAMHRAPSRSRPTTEFQSTPDLAAGRCVSSPASITCG